MVAQLSSLVRRVSLAGATMALTLAGITSVTTPPAWANEPFYPKAPVDLIMPAMPQWNFAQANNNPTCWPSDSLVGSNFAQSATAGRKAWPDADSGCPAVNSSFPTYVSARKCAEGVVRTSYTLYFKKDGFAPGELGHGHDFEYVIVEWRKRDGAYYRDKLIMSRHGKHFGRNWADVESWNGARAGAGLGLEHPAIYVGWGKHAMFNSQGGLKDLTSQFTNDEYRSTTWRVWPKNTWLVGDKLHAGLWDRYNWGSATSTPEVVSRNLCKYTWIYEPGV
ncbi:Necrosis inducing protein (NPP1) [Nonomuraea solani]|uniref:Necrosis inducing protein (NPP1) n=2 Tax=Nonomuraea solani TaxID=1144553 RepID=A0A1H5YBS0_9ACTN|nr:Necrosis inducing protein (NPP1) [Nonomuraea solani]